MMPDWFHGSTVFYTSAMHAYEMDALEIITQTSSGNSKVYFLCKVKVLILHQHFNTPEKGGPLRSYYLAKALLERGIQPIVITAGQTVGHQTVQLEGIEIHYLPIAYDNRFGFWKRSLSFLVYAWRSVWLAGRFKDAQVCYAISVPLTVGLAARAIKRLYQIPFIFEVGDLWPEAPIQMGFIRNHFFKQVLYHLEKSTYKSAESIVALSVAIKQSIELKVPEKTVHLIPNISDTEYFKPEKKDESLELKFGVKGKFVVSYIGAIGLANGLDFFVRCAQVSERTGLPVYFLLCGDGAMLNAVKSAVEKYQLKNFQCIPFQNRDGVRDIMNVTDATFICYRPIPVLETGSPNKYFDGLAAGKLIILNFEGWIKKEIEEHSCGVQINSSDAGDFLKKIKPFTEDPLLLESYQTRSRLLALQCYSRSILGGKFASLFYNER